MARELNGNSQLVTMLLLMLLLLLLLLLMVMMVMMLRRRHQWPQEQEHNVSQPRVGSSRRNV